MLPKVRVRLDWRRQKHNLLRLQEGEPEENEQLQALGELICHQILWDSDEKLLDQSCSKRLYTITVTNLLGREAGKKRRHFSSLTDEVEPLRNSRFLTFELGFGAKATRDDEDLDIEQ